jgi:N-acylneuraminate cytidylyltransferase/CMP-N,N'-diacetyllegionaminic acid synthase
MILGQPLIARTIETARSSGCFDRVIVSTDCEEIAEVARNAGAEVPLLRPPELATDSARTIDVILHLAQELRLPLDSFVCVLQPTSPMRSEADIRRSWQLLVESSGNSVLSVTRFKLANSWLMAMGSSKALTLPSPELAPSNRQESAACFYPNGAIYWSRLERVLNTGAIISAPCYGYEMNFWSSVDIDTIEDFRAAEALLAAREKTGESGNGTS